MPKEVIRAVSLPYGEDEGARSVAEIRWDRDAGHVSLVTRCMGIDGMVWIPPHVREPLEAAGFVTATSLVSSNDQRQSVHLSQDGWFVDLDRYGLNALIRNARRARDQAFGRDE